MTSETRRDSSITIMEPEREWTTSTSGSKPMIFPFLCGSVSGRRPWSRQLSGAVTFFSYALRNPKDRMGLLPPLRNLCWGAFCSSLSTLLALTGLAHCACAVLSNQAAKLRTMIKDRWHQPLLCWRMLCCCRPSEEEERWCCRLIYHLTMQQADVKYFIITQCW